MLTPKMNSKENAAMATDAQLEPAQAPDIFDFIEEEINNLGPGLGLPTEGIFRDWRERPDQLAERSYDGGLEPDSVMDIRCEMNSLFGYYDNNRPPMGMLNAVSGAGKTTLFQYYERYFNQERKYFDDTRALHISFDKNRRRDGRDLTADQGLAIRIAERFLCKEGSFDVVHECWRKSKALKSRVTFHEVVLAVVKMLEQKQKRTLLFIEEPGLAGDETRTEEEGMGSLPRVAKDVAGDLIESLRGNTCKGVRLYSLTDVMLLKKNLRIVVSSLTPVYNNEWLEGITDRGRMRIISIDVPLAVGDRPKDSGLERKVKKYCRKLGERMHPDDFDKSMRLLIALASGHWNTLTELMNTANDGASLSNANVSWLRTIYLQNVRDALAMHEGIVDDANLRKATFDKLLKYTIVQKPVRPFDKMWEASGDEMSLVDLATKRVVLNSFPFEGYTFKQVAPRLSVLDVRHWCRNDLGEDNDNFSRMILGFLQQTGNDPTNPRATVESNKSGKTFEVAAAYFLVAKLLAWKDVEPMEAYYLGEIFYNNWKPRLVEKNLFPGHTIVCGEHHKISIQSSTPRILQVKGTGFHNKKDDESEDEYNDQEQKGNTEAWEEEISIHEATGSNPVTSLHCGDVLFLGSRNQPHSDALFIAELPDGKTGLLFLQYKFSESESTTVQSSEDIQNGLDRLLEERDVLFGGGLKGKNPSNQIAALEVDEEDVIYCWSILRGIPRDRNQFFRKIREHAVTKDFKGTILVAENSCMYGPTFSNLAEVLSDL